MSRVLEAFLSTDRLEAFKAFIVERGAELREPTNEWEVLRFAVGKRVNVVYTSKKGRISVSGNEINLLVEDFVADIAEERPRERAPARPNEAKRKKLRAQLLKRDGRECFYCGEEAGEGVVPTIEHLLSRVHRGPDTLENTVLACQPCNEEAGDLTVIEKVRLREKKRRERGLL